MNPQGTAVEPTTEAPQDEAVSENIARFVKEHELSATRRNMHIHEDDDEGTEDD